jgi:hypothetical protein
MENIYQPNQMGELDAMHIELHNWKVSIFNNRQHKFFNFLFNILMKISLSREKEFPALI